MAYAAPAGGILCLELLKCTFHGHPHDVKITRSSIIQHLSLLVGFLDWVSPLAPNGDLCVNCRTVIQRVLDLTLNVAPGPGAEPPPPPPDGWDFAGMDFGDSFGFDLLDTFEWMRPEMASGQ